MTLWGVKVPPSFLVCALNATPSEYCAGNYQKEGDCYNRERSFPKSAWNGSEIAAYTDLFHLYPADGYDNNRRSNYWLGNVDPNVAPEYETTNGSKLGNCVAASGMGAGHVGTGATDVLPQICWEPSDGMKGELARSYFYISVSYADIFTCCNTDGNDGATLKPWLLATLLDWHDAFPVSPSEVRRNDAIYALQQNRNPFIDFPEWATKVFASASG